MKTVYKCIAGCLIFSIAAFLFPNAALCKDPRLMAKTEPKKITRHEPKIMSTPAKAIPMELTEAGKTSGVGKWVLIGVGAAAVVALVAGGGGGGSSDNEKNHGPEPAKPSNISFGW